MLSLIDWVIKQSSNGKGVPWPMACHHGGKKRLQLEFTSISARERALPDLYPPQPSSLNLNQREVTGEERIFINLMLNCNQKET